MFPGKEGKIEIRVSGRWQSMSGSIEPVRRTTGRFIQPVRLAAGSARMSRGSCAVRSVPTHLGVMVPSLVTT